YEIGVADRQALIAQEERDQRAADAEADNRAGRRGRHRHRGAGRHRGHDVMRSDPLPEAQDSTDIRANERGVGSPLPGEIAGMGDGMPVAEASGAEFIADEAAEIAPSEEALPAEERDQPIESTVAPEQPFETEGAFASEAAETEYSAQAVDTASAQDAGGNGGSEEHAEEEAVESVGGADALEEVQERLPRFRRQYKIQEVIKRRQ